MISCSFCSNTKSQRYVYTECNHFVCVNCAALRSGDTLMCCNKSTILDASTKNFLAQKKLTIMENLQKEYEYEKTDINKISFDQIQQKLNIINQIQQEQSSKKTKKNYQNQNNDALENVKQYNFQNERNFIVEADVQTPIKLVTSPSVLHNNNNQKNSQIKRELSSKKPSNFKAQIIKLKQPSLSINEFSPLLQTQLDFIKGEFQSLYEYLRKIQNDTVQEVKVYFQEYVKLIKKDFDEGIITLQSIDSQKKRLKVYLETTIQKSKLNEVKRKLLNEDLKFLSENKNFESKEKLKIEQKMLEKEFQKSKRALESVRNNNQSLIDRMQDVIKVDTNESFFENLRLNTMRDPLNNLQNENLSPQPATTTNRNLDKIYRKLEQSRTKLQQRIQLHNQFMNKRCSRMSNA